MSISCHPLVRRTAKSKETSGTAKEAKSAKQKNLEKRSPQDFLGVLGYLGGSKNDFAVVLTP